MSDLERFWAWLTAWPRGCVSWLHAATCALMTEEGRKAWALVIAWGCGIAMTGYAAAVLWFVRRSPMLAFWLGLSAMGIVLVVITGIMVLLGVRRDIHVKRGDSEGGIEDHSGPP